MVHVDVAALTCMLCRDPHGAFKLDRVQTTPSLESMADPAQSLVFGTISRFHASSVQLTKQEIFRAREVLGTDKSWRGGSERSLRAQRRNRICCHRSNSGAHRFKEKGVQAAKAPRRRMRRIIICTSKQRSSTLCEQSKQWSGRPHAHRFCHEQKR